MNGEQLCLSEESNKKQSKERSTKGVFCNIRFFFVVLKYGNHWYIKQWITTNQLIAMNS